MQSDSERTLFTLEMGYVNAISSLAFSPDGRKLPWDAISDAAFSRDCSRVVVASCHGASVLAHDITSGRKRYASKGSETASWR
jgi:hypothetical protein